MSTVDAMWMMTFLKQRHINDGRCASAHWLNDGCLGTDTQVTDVTGHVRSAGYNSARKAVQACHDYSNQMTYWTERYVAEHGWPQLVTVRMLVERARRARYEEVMA
jgi:hypothetical protein